MLCSNRARLAVMISVMVLIVLHSLDASALSCEYDSDCDDGLGCTFDLCNGSVCEWIPDSGACQDAFFCNGYEVCDPENPEANANGCVEGSPVQCGAGLPDCVVSVCSEETSGCIDTPDDSLCDDGFACNGSETCDLSAGCLEGTPVCADEWLCTTDECTELGSGAYECNFIPDHTICADAYFCNGAELCAPSDPNHNALGCLVDVPDPNCSDSFACTVDYCSEAQKKCMNVADNGYCNDNEFCNGQETCNPTASGHLADGCLIGTAPDCNDNVGCTDDSCDEVHDVCVNEARDSNCDDFNPCTGPDTCNEVNDCFNPYVNEGTVCTMPGGGNGVCRSGVCTTGCYEDSDCNDGLACTIDTCNTETETCVFTADNTYCNNGQWCDGSEICAPGNPGSDAEGCLSGDAPDCTDAHTCTVDGCDETNDVCTHTPDDGLCSNGTWCDGAEICSATSGCIVGSAPCDDGVSCTEDVCTEASHSCVNTPADALCDDGLWCNGDETCDAVNDCQAGVAQNCDDGTACTDDSCDEINDACVNTVNNSNCEDYNDCTTQYCDAALDCQYTNVTNGDTCQLNPFIQGVCFDGLCQESCTFDEDCPAPACVTAQCSGGLCHFTLDNAYCNDSNICNGVESCNPNHPDAGSDGCVVTTAPLNCNDSIGCTADTCHPTLGCRHVADDGWCSDDNPCNGEEICNATSGCQDAADPACDDGIACTVDSCDEVEGCLHVPQNSLCQNGQFCDGSEICDAVLGCQDGPDPSCADAFSCTADSCDETNDVCRHTPVKSNCDNNEYCDGEEVCNPYDENAQADGCVPGSAPNCDDGFDCTADSCDEQNNSCYHAPLDVLCNDEYFCNGDEYCDPGDPLSGEDGCVAGISVDCDDDIGCTIDECDEATDSCEHSEDHAGCDDGKWCNGTEYCSAGFGCYSLNAPSCADAFNCTLDSCDEVNDVCAYQPRDWLCADTSVCNGDETCAVGSGCVAGSPMVCADEWSCTYDYCDDLQGGCVYEKRHTNCIDSYACNGEESCNPEAVNHDEYGCVPGEPVECEDGISCTTGVCNELPPNGYYCTQEPYDSLCDDGNDCNGIETCDESSDCQDGVPRNCNDFVDCTDDSCNTLNGQCVNTPNDANCANSNPCQPLVACDVEGGCIYGILADDTPCDINPALAERCLGGFCVPADVQCQNDDECDDDIACTTDTCTGGKCTYTADNSVCQNGQFCDGVEVCIIGVGCQSGPKVDCREQPVDIACTNDECHEESDSCSHTPINNWCDNGNYCDGVETCNALQGCMAGTPVECPSDGIGCTSDVCNENTHSCGHVPNDSVCQNGLYCDGAEVCDLAEDCRPGIAPIVDDGIPCTIDSCGEGANLSDNIGQVLHTPDNSVCLNGYYCDGAESCFVDIGCVNGTPPTLSDGVACTSDSCSEGLDDSDNVGTVLHEPDHAYCQNGYYCDGAEICDTALGCQNGEAPPVDDQVGCTVDACLEGANTDDNVGNITHTPSDALCQDGLYCNGAETCDAMEDCQPGSPRDYDDGIPCTDDSCSEGENLSDNIGSILNIPSPVFCLDSDLCNGSESCVPDSEEADGNGCIPGQNVICNDEIACTGDSCNPHTGECEFIPDDTLCGDDVVCTFDICDVQEGCRNPPLDDGELCDVDPELFEVCFEGVCVKGCQQDEDCVDAFDCTAEECDMETLLCRIITDDDLCADEFFCNGDEICNPEQGCIAGTAVSCVDEYVCTSNEHCDEENDQCLADLDPAACDDENPCTDDDCAIESGCVYSNVEDGTSCGDGLECLDGECVEIITDGDVDSDEETEPEVEEDGDIEDDAEIEADAEAEPDGDIEDDADSSESDEDAEGDIEMLESEAESDSDSAPDGDADTVTDGDVEGDDDGDGETEDESATDGDMATDGGSSAGCGGCSSGDAGSWPLGLMIFVLLTLWRRRAPV